MHLSSRKGAVLFVKILVVFCVVLVPLYVVGLFIYLGGTDALRNRLLQTELSQLQSTARRLDQEYEHVESMEANYIENYDLRHLALASSVMTNYERATTILSIQDDLALLCAASPIIEDATVDFPDLKRRVSRRGADLYVLRDETRSVSGGSTFNSDTLAVETFYPPNAAIFGVQFVLRIYFSPQKIGEIISGATFSSNGSAFLVDAKGRILSASAKRQDTERTVREVVNATSDAASVQVIRRIGDTSVLISAVRADHFNSWVASVFPEKEVFGPLTGYRSWFWALTALTIGLGGLFAFWISSTLRRPLAKLMDGFQAVEAGDMTVQLAREHNDEFGYIFDHFNAMVTSLDATMRRCVEQESLARHAELLQLQAQINPHFLYNSIYHIYRMAKDEDFQSIERYALHLGSYYQFITHSASEETLLSEEARHARNYSEVQSVRFRERIAVDLGEVPPRVEGLRVPRLIVQPLLENAYNHGLKDVVADGMIVVRYDVLESELVVSVADNGKGMSPEEMQSFTALLHCPSAEGQLSGIVNIHRRLMLRFGDAAGVSLGVSSLGGLRISLRIPVTEPN